MLQFMGSERVRHDWATELNWTDTWLLWYSGRELNWNQLWQRQKSGMSRYNWNIIGMKSEKVMAPHSSTLAWKMLWKEEPGSLQSMGSLTVGHDWMTSLSLFTFMHWGRKLQPIPVFLPRESQGWRSLVHCHLWCHTELDTTEAT